MDIHAYYNILLVIFLNYCSPRDNFGIVPSVTSPQNVRIVSILNREQVEELYKQFMISNTSGHDPVCSLTKAKKTALCERIFQLFPYKDLQIYLNKIAFFIAASTCEVKHLRFKTRSDIPDDILIQEMYACHGRHNPVRSSFIEDDYRDKFHLSAGPDNNSVMVYIHEYDAESDWYNVYSNIKNFNLTELPDKFITVTEVNEELEFNKGIISTSKHEELEYVYIREKDASKPDPVCDLEETKKMSLCRLIFDRFIYKHFFWIKINNIAFYILKPNTCTENRLKIRYSERLKDDHVSQKMFPCYSQSRLTFGNPLSGKYLKYFYVSGGPRTNSVFVYSYKKLDNDREEFYLFDLLENVTTKDLESKIITYDEELANKSLTQPSYSSGFNSALERFKAITDESAKVEAKKVDLKKISLKILYRIKKLHTKGVDMTSTKEGVQKLLTQFEDFTSEETSIDVRKEISQTKFVELKKHDKETDFLEGKGKEIVGEKREIVKELPDADAAVKEDIMKKKEMQLKKETQQKKETETKKSKKGRRKLTK